MKGGILLNQDQMYDRLEEWFRAYPRWKARIETLKVELGNIQRITQHLQLVQSKSEGSITNATLDTVTRRLEILEEELPQFELRVQLIEVALQSLLEEDRMFIELRYFKKQSVMRIADRLNLSRSGFYRKRIEVLDNFYEVIGGENAPIWLGQ